VSEASKVKLLIRKYVKEGRDYVSYQVTLPKAFVEGLNFSNEKELNARIVTVTIDGKTVTGILLYKP
jgi:hypothetical protein